METFVSMCKIWKKKYKSRIRETLNLSTNADSIYIAMKKEPKTKGGSSNFFWSPTLFFFWGGPIFFLYYFSWQSNSKPSKCYKTNNLNMWQNLKTISLTNQKLKLLKNSKIKMVTKLNLKQNFQNIIVRTIWHLYNLWDVLRAPFFNLAMFCS